MELPNLCPSLADPLYFILKKLMYLLIKSKVGNS